jgi:hypothetical protein
LFFEHPQPAAEIKKSDPEGFPNHSEEKNRAPNGLPGASYRQKDHPKTSWNAPEIEELRSNTFRRTPYARKSCPNASPNALNTEKSRWNTIPGRL